jgi:hypothetical protein
MSGDVPLLNFYLPAAPSFLNMPFLLMVGTAGGSGTVVDRGLDWDLLELS